MERIEAMKGSLVLLEKLDLAPNFGQSYVEGFVEGAEVGLAAGRMEAKAELARALSERGMSQREIAGILGTSQSSVSRVLGNAKEQTPIETD